MAEEKVKVEIEIPKDQLSVVAPESENKEKQESDSEKESKSPGHQAELELGKLQEELAYRRKRFEESAPIKEGGNASLAPILEKIPAAQDSSPPNSRQKLLIVCGLAAIAAGFILWPLTAITPAIVVAAVGALLVIAGTLVKV